MVASAEAVDCPAAIRHSHVAFAASPPVQGRAVVNSSLLILMTLAPAWPQLNTWLADTLTTAPTLLLVLAVLVVLPPLALAGVMMRRQRHSPDSTQLISRPSLRDGNPRRA
ncbi:MAG: hypothetical protein WC684_11825, partial [Hyphomicrobium sp.]